MAQFLPERIEHFNQTLVSFAQANASRSSGSAQPVKSAVSRRRAAPEYPAYLHQRKGLLQNAKTRHFEGACDREIRFYSAKKCEKETDFSLRSK